MNLSAAARVKNALSQLGIYADEKSCSIIAREIAGIHSKEELFDKMQIIAGNLIITGYESLAGRLEEIISLIIDD